MSPHQSSQQIIKFFALFGIMNFVRSFSIHKIKHCRWISCARHEHDWMTSHATIHYRWLSAHPNQASLTRKRPHHHMAMSLNYYQHVSSLTNFSTKSNRTHPEWWPSGTSELKHIALMDHIAHVIVPDASTISEEPTIICEEVIQWVLKAANQTVMANDSRQVRIDEWNEGNQVSNSSHILDPAYRHDPSTLPLPTRDKSNLNPVELLALGSIWYLSVTAAPPNIDRFDPSNGIKPRRLSVGDWNMTVQHGDYLRIHFDPRRFRETNKFNWGCRVGSTEDAKPGVIVARNDEMGYIVIDKPSNIPVHARVDNVLENVASSVGKMLWIEKKGEYPSKTINALTHQKDIGRNKQKQKMEQLIYVATPQRLDQNTTGLMVVATKKSFAAYFAKLLRTKVNQVTHLLHKCLSTCSY